MGWMGEERRTFSQSAVVGSALSDPEGLNVELPKKPPHPNGVESRGFNSIEVPASLHLPFSYYSNLNVPAGSSRGKSAPAPVLPVRPDRPGEGTTSLPLPRRLG